MEILIPILILIPLVLLLIKLRLDFIRGKNQLEDCEYTMEEPVLIDYNGKDVYIPEEDMAVWNDLPRNTKRETIRKQEKMVRQGLLVPIQLPNGEKRLITRAEAIEKNVIHG